MNSMTLAALLVYINTYIHHICCSNRPEFSGQTRSKPFASGALDLSPGNQHMWYWQSMTNKSWRGRGVKCLHHIDIETCLKKNKCIFMFHEIGLKTCSVSLLLLVILLFLLWFNILLLSCRANQSSHVVLRSYVHRLWIMLCFSLGFIKRHWKRQHSNNQFRYVLNYTSKMIVNGKTFASCISGTVRCRTK